VPSPSCPAPAKTTRADTTHPGPARSSDDGTLPRPARPVPLRRRGGQLRARPEPCLRQGVRRLGGRHVLQDVGDAGRQADLAARARARPGVGRHGAPPPSGPPRLRRAVETPPGARPTALSQPHAAPSGAAPRGAADAQADRSRLPQENKVRLAYHADDNNWWIEKTEEFGGARTAFALASSSALHTVDALTQKQAAARRAPRTETAPTLRSRAAFSRARSAYRTTTAKAAACAATPTSFARSLLGADTDALLQAVEICHGHEHEL